jgi:dipeptidyl aminopeptidase/acylaminoacyl peptidase
MAPAKYISYPARDGLEIPAYLTLPKGRVPKALPLVILPHGGPYSVRDLPDYDAEVQFLANRGYAVLRPNYRGSDSYGEEFYKKGEGQIGRKMQDDLDDGMDWLVKEGIVDPSRVCLVGGSYGGYAALWGVIRNPERYRCAASFAGVTDYKAQMKYDFKSIGSRYRKDWRSTLQGAEEFDLDNVSPSKQAHKISRPILLAHGDSDSRVPFTQFDGMLDAAKKSGTKKFIESHVYKEEGHGFSDAANQKDWLVRLEAFLAKHTAPQTPAEPLIVDQ